MVKFIARRLAAGVFLLFAISTLAFTLLYTGGSNIARNILGQTASEEAVARKTAELGLDQPIWTQYWDWLKNAVTGDFGVSWFSSSSVSSLVMGRLGTTFSFVITALVLAAIIGVLIGAISASKRGWVDRVFQLISLVLSSIPNYLIALALVLVFAIQLSIFKATGYTPPSESLSAWFNSITLPVIALLVGTSAGIAQQVRSSMIDNSRMDYVRTLRSHGLSEKRVVFIHTLRNSAGPALSIISLMFVGLLGGAVVIEQMFAIPGLGALANSSAVRSDIPVVMGVVVTTAVIVILVNLTIDILQGLLNPKARVSS